MDTDLLGLRGAIANGSEPTFDGQPMHPGIHLRWSFAPELGFPPHGFQLCRKKAGQGERRIVPPRDIWTRGGDTRDTPTAGTSTPSGQPSTGSSEHPSQGSSSSSADSPQERGTTPSNDVSSHGTGTGPLPWKPGKHECHARLPEKCHNISVSGVAAEGVEEVVLETYAHVTATKVVITGRHCAKVEQQRFTAEVRTTAITAIRIIGAASIEECSCGLVDPPRSSYENEDEHKDKDECEDEDEHKDEDECENGDGHKGAGNGGHKNDGNGGHKGDGPGGHKGDGSHGGNGGNGHDSGEGNGQPPRWGKPDRDGWQCLSTIFTLPITKANWPARYAGAPNPFAPDAIEHDVEECIRRLGGLRLEKDMTTTAMHDNLVQLRAALEKLVQGYPSRLLYDVPIDMNAEDGANAPVLGMRLMQQLLLLSLNPYMARVLGLYYVDTDIEDGIAYDYHLVGLWGDTQCATRSISPGAASATQLAQGEATIGGVTVSSSSPDSPSKTSTLSRWSPATNPTTYLIQTRNSWNLNQFQVESFTSIMGEMKASELLVLQAKSSTSPSICHFALRRPAEQVDIQVASLGQVIARHNGTAVATQDFNSATLTTLTLTPPNPSTQPIDELIVVAEAPFVVIGTLLLHLVRPRPNGIGYPYAQYRVDAPIVPLAAPAQPVAINRHRQAELDPSGPILVPRSSIEVQWTAPASSTIIGTPSDPPVDVPLPNQPIGYRAERMDTGIGSTVLLPRIIAPMSVQAPTDSPLAKAVPPPSRIVRFSDYGLPDPEGGWTYHVAAFDAFGVLSSWSTPSTSIGVQPVAAEPTSVRIIKFDNSSTGGGAPSANGQAWVGGTLTLDVTWTGASLVSYPDTATARISVETIDMHNLSQGILFTQELAVPSRKIISLIVTGINAILDAKGQPIGAHITTGPQLQLLTFSAQDPTPLLILVGQSASGKPIIEQYSERPKIASDGSITVTVPISSISRIFTSKNAFVNQKAFLVLGFSMGVLDLSLAQFKVPIDQQTARGRVFVEVSTQAPFALTGPSIDRNAPNFPPSAKAVFTGQQWLIPPKPAMPDVPIPTHIVHHEYYDPADFYGRATRRLPFSLPPLPGVSGYVLLRAPLQSLFLADLKRRQATGLLDLSFSLREADGTTRGDLQLWNALLTEWRDAYNLRTYGTGTSKWLSNETMLNDSNALRAFIDHFYSGLLDDELRMLANIKENLKGFARVDDTPFTPPLPPLTDTVDGKGFGRVLYKLTAVNKAGNSSSETGAVGPYYTRIVTPPRPPVLYRVLPKNSGLVIEWALDNNPDSGGYLVYRAKDPHQLTDLRYFGKDAAHPTDPTNLAQLRYLPREWPPLSFNTDNDSADMMDQRLIALVPDPRLFARDYSDGEYGGVHYNGSDMGEVVLPAGIVPDQIHAVYRLSEFDPALPAEPVSQRQAFNYWYPGQGSTSQLVKDSATQARILGLRLGLGRGVAVVVVASVGGKITVLGLLPSLPGTQTSIRRMPFFDNVAGTNTDQAQRFNRSPLDAGTLYYYTLVAVDIFGNRSNPAKVFAARTLGLAQAVHP